MNCKIKVSIIVPVYNEAKTITKSIESILQQTLKDIEIIIVDDGSCDDSVNIIKDYQKIYKNILLYNQNNLGAGPARNYALEVAHGEFICFMDADDYYLDVEALEKMYDALITNKMEICCGLMQFNSNGIISLSNINRDLILMAESKIIGFKDYQNDAFFQCYMFKKELLDRENIRFMPLRRYQDPPFLVTALHYAENNMIINVEFYCYRKTQNKIVFNHEKTNDMVRGLKWELEFAEQNTYIQLEKRVLQRINITYANYILDNIKNNQELITLLMEIKKNLGYQKPQLDILEYIDSENAHIEYEVYLIRNRLLRRIGKNKSIVLYGAGKNGVQVYNAIKKEEDISIVCWVDKHKEGEVIDNIKICSINEINQNGYDYIFITVEDKQTCNEIITELIKEKCKRNKIFIWTDIM